MAEFDALIAGGGPAGCAIAAGLSALGFRALLVDAGVDPTKQLAGELMHPPGVDDLESLGFSAAVRAANPQLVRGFAVLDKEATALLPYAASEGMALEHAILRRALLEDLERRAGIAVRRRTRVVGVSNNDPYGVDVVIRQEDGAEERTRVRLLVAADGRSSPVRRLLGIEEGRDRLSSMVGVLVDAAQLPFKDHGHLFIGGGTPVLGYAITPGQARIMVDLPAGARAGVLAEAPEMLDGLPVVLRTQIAEAVRSGQVLIAANETRLPATVAVHSVALVGDAAGCCHPLSASGLASCTRDAMVLRSAIERYPDDIPAALQLYAKRRRAPQRTRIALASALYRTFSERSPEMAALRHGLFRYWEKSRRGRVVSMALLSTRELRMGVMAREYARAVAYALIGLASALARRGPPRASLGTAARLIRSTFPHFGGAIRGAFEDFRLAMAMAISRMRGWGRAQERPGEPEPSRAPLPRV